MFVLRLGGSSVEQVAASERQMTWGASICAAKDTLCEDMQMQDFSIFLAGLPILAPQRSEAFQMLKPAEDNLSRAGY